MDGAGIPPVPEAEKEGQKRIVKSSKETEANKAKMRQRVEEGTKCREDLFLSSSEKCRHSRMKVVHHKKAFSLGGHLLVYLPLVVAVRGAVGS